MTPQKATEYLQWYKNKSAEYLYLARFKTSRPFPIDYPEAGLKKRKAQIVLGIHEFQRDYKTLLTRYPYLTEERYNKQRAKLGI